MNIRIVCTMALMVVAIVTNAAIDIKFNCSKNTWSTIGNENGEVIGTVTVVGIDNFDHVEAEIRCKEDPYQYITLSNIYKNGSSLMCYTWEGGHYDLTYGYHYTMTIKAFDVPWYGALPVAATTYSFVGTGAAAIPYCDIEMTGVSLAPNDVVLNGYNINGTTFDVTFSAPVSRVEAWWAQGFDGAEYFSTSKKSADGRTWTVQMSDQVLFAEGSVCIMVTAWNRQDIQIRGDNADHAYALNIVVSDSSPDITGINNVTTRRPRRPMFNMAGERLSPDQPHKGIIVIDGKKWLMK